MWVHFLQLTILLGCQGILHVLSVLACRIYAIVFDFTQADYSARPTFQADMCRR